MLEWDKTSSYNCFLATSQGIKGAGAVLGATAIRISRAIQMAGLIPLSCHESGFLVSTTGVLAFKCDSMILYYFDFFSLS